MKYTKAKLVLLLLCLGAALSVALVTPDPAYACRDYDGHRNSVVPPSCGSYAGGDIHAAIDSVGLPPIFHAITERESGSGADLYNESSGACGYFQFMPETYAAYGYTCTDLYDPYTAAQAALELYQDYGLSPWAATTY